MDEVKAGALWMDEHHPGWAEKIDLTTFDMQMPCVCVLGQVRGNYNDACMELGWLGLGQDKAAASLGFTVNRSRDEIEPRHWRALQDAWVIEILWRRDDPTGMDIGKQQPARIVEPMKEPVPTRQPKKEPKTAPAPTPTPEKVPEKVPVKT